MKEDVISVTVEYCIFLIIRALHKSFYKLKLSLLLWTDTIRNSKLEDINYVSIITRDVYILSVHARDHRTHRLKRIVPFSESDKESRIACRSNVNN